MTFTPLLQITQSGQPVYTRQQINGKSQPCGLKIKCNPVDLKGQRGYTVQASIYFTIVNITTQAIPVSNLAWDFSFLDINNDNQYAPDNFSAIFYRLNSITLQFEVVNEILPETQATGWIYFSYIQSNYFCCSSTTFDFLARLKIVNFQSTNQPYYSNLVSGSNLAQACPACIAKEGSETPIF